MATIRCGLAALTFVLAACSSEPAATPAGSGGAGATATTAAAGGAGGSGGGEDAAARCLARGLSYQPFDAAGPFGTRRHDLAEDFEVPLSGGATWRLSEHWTGCDTHVFLTSARVTSALDTTSLWDRPADVAALVAGTPDNAHYFFVPARGADEAALEGDTVAGHLAAALDALEPRRAAALRERFHVVAVHAGELDGWLGPLLGGMGRAGFAIDRNQRIRLLGNFADVTRFDSALDAAGQWPWTGNLAYATHEVRQYNYEAKREATLAAEAATVLTPWQGEVLAHQVETEVTFPDAATMAGFDTFQIDLTMDCPDPELAELGNCGAWDYLSHIRLLDEDGETWIEMARFITTYHREGRYLVDATPMLAFLRDGGERTIRFDVSPEHNPQAYLTRMDLRLSNQGKGHTPSQAVPLFAGGNFGPTYNDAYEPIEVPIPVGATRVELWAVITGHGGATLNCAEFCRHQHEVTVNGNAYLKDHPEAGKQEGCVAQIDHGMVPNQSGTWWFGRGGWCPGQQVEPWVVDVTADVTPGETATVSYRGRYSGGEPPANAGNIVMTSFLVIHEPG